MAEPVVSVCIPSYNAAGTIRETIQSVLDQTFTAFELFIVDDASSDATAEVVRSFDDPRISLQVNEQNGGAVVNWNRCVSDAKGRYTKLLCSDDVLAPTALQRQVDVLEQNLDVVLVACKRKVLDDLGNVLTASRGLAGLNGKISGSEAIKTIVRSGTNPLGEPAAVLMRTEIMQKCLPWSADFPYMIDVVMWERMLEHGDLYAIPEVLATFRIGTMAWSKKLLNQQRLHATGFVRDVRKRRPDLVSDTDARVGVAKATILPELRRGAYWWMELRRNLKRH